jgi:hypothetical protein
VTATSELPRVAVLILTWNRVDELVPCLESFSCSTYPNTTVVVIDNGSEDESPETVKRDYPWVTARTWASAAATTSGCATRWSGASTT